MHPYKHLPAKQFWAPAVAQRSMFDIDELWDPKFRIRRATKVATFGSCFAQHIGRALRARGYTWFLTEPAPAGLLDATAKRFNYGIFTARTGNIYTVSLLKQWVQWALGQAEPPDEAWEQGGRFYDPFRPNIEPDGFASKAEMVASRKLAIECFYRCLAESEIFVFTLGLTESWFHSRAGYEYPMCPGTVAGSFNAEQHRFVNQDYNFIRKTLAEALRSIRSVNQKLRFVLTVSPVPLTATMSGNHVLVATMESKSILRAVAGSLARDLPFVDYFPSYEIINAAPFRASFFEPNLRSVHSVGVAHVMNNFFGSLTKKFGIERATPGVRAPEPDNDVACEEELLGAFAGGAR